MPEINEIVGGLLVLSNRVRLGISPVILVKGKHSIVYDTAGPNARQYIAKELARKRIDPKKVDMLVISHSHWDHAMNPDIFPNAKILIGKEEYDYGKHVSKSDWATPTYINRLYEGHEIEKVDSEFEIDKGVKIIRVPGHTPGTLGLEVETKEGTAILGSDALFNARSFIAGIPLLVFYSKTKARASLARMKREGSIFYPGHDRPFRFDGKKLEFISNGILDIEVVMPPYMDNFHYHLDTKRLKKSLEVHNGT